MEEINATTIEKEHFHTGQLMAVLGVAVLLLGISYMKNPKLFSFHKQEVKVASADVPHYYPYVQPEKFNQPMVAGASTVPNGPSVINEDGSISPVNDIGEVLGASTEDVNLSLNAIQVAEIPDSPQAVQKYLSDTDKIEGTYINDTEFQEAITSNNQDTINKQVEKIKSIIAELKPLKVPHAAAALQKNKLLQYEAAIQILQNYTNVDNNPELVSQALGVFLQTQQTQDDELTKLKSQFITTNENAGQ